MKKSFKRFLTVVTAAASLVLASATAFASTEGAQSGSSGGGSGSPMGGALTTILLTFVPIILVGYFMIYRPEKKRKKESQALKDSLKPGDRITTIGGIVGTVETITDEEIHLTNGLVLKRWALRSIDPATSSVTYYEDEEDDSNKDE